MHSTSSPLEAALEYTSYGWPVLPLHTPVEVSKDYPSGCDCRRQCEDIGKHPRTRNGVNDSSIDADQIRKWWALFPTANVGIDLAKARLLDIAPDSVEWHAEFIARGLPRTLTFASGGGAGHFHHLYRLPDGVPQTRVCHSGEYDVLAAGYAVMPPSIHRSGLAYLWLRDDLPLADPPAWACALLAERPKAGRAAPGDIGEVVYDEAFNRLLESVDMRAWHGELALDRSGGLFAIAKELLKAGANGATVLHWLRERDITLGWFKYADRSDSDDWYVYTLNKAAAEVATEPERVGRATARVRAQQQAEADEVEWESPSDPYTGWPEPIDQGAFYGPLGDFVMEIAEQTEADPAALLAEGLSGLSAAFSPETYMRAGNAQHPARVNTVLVGMSGAGRKGTAMQVVEDVLAVVDETMKRRIIGGLSSGEGLIWVVRDSISKFDSKKQEDVIVDAGESDKRVLIVESEFGSTLRVLQREGNTLSGVVRRAWDISTGAMLQSLTKNSQAKATSPHIVITGHVTRDELMRYVDRTDLVNGFANRFLWFATRRRLILPLGDEVARGPLLQLGYLAGAAMEWGRDGHRMRWSPEARDLWIQAYPRLSDERPGLYGGMTARAAPQVIRVAVLYATLDKTNEIGLGALRAALAVSDYSDRTAAWIFGESTGDEIADDILITLRDEGPLTRTEIYRSFGNHVRKGPVDRALRMLERSGLARVKKTSTRGRPAETWGAT